MSATAWDALKRNPQDLQMLQRLSSSRHALPAMTSDEVNTMLEVLNQLWQVRAADAERLTGFTNVFSLLASWAHNVQLPAADQHRQASTAPQQLQSAVKGALQLLQSPWLAPNATTACIMYLGAASKGCQEAQIQHFALLACSAMQALRCQLADVTHIRMLTSGVGHIIISLQCQGPLVLWLLSNVLALWSPTLDSASNQGQHAIGSLSSIDQALPISSMMHQIGVHLVQSKARASQHILSIAVLVATAAESGFWQEGTTGVLAAGALLEELVRAPASQAKLSAPVQLLSNGLSQACSASQQALAAAAALASQHASHQDLQPQHAGCALWRDAAAVALCQAWQAAPFRVAPPALVTCLMSSLWSSSLSLKGLFEVAAQGRPPEQGTSWLQGHVKGKLLQDAPAMARVSAELYKLADEATQQVCRDILHHGAVEVYEGYRQYAATTPPAWLQAVDAAAVRQVLDRSFMAAVLLMTTIWQVTTSTDRLPQNLTHGRGMSASPAPLSSPAPSKGIPAAPAPATSSAASHDQSLIATIFSKLGLGWSSADVKLEDNGPSGNNGMDSAAERSASIAAGLLNSLSYLQFCRMRLTAYNALLKGLLSAVSGSSQATQQLVGSMPSYEEVTSLQLTLSQPHPSTSASQHPPTPPQSTPANPQQQPVWLTDAILASRVQFLMGMLAPCLVALPEGQDAAQLASVVFLYLQHPQSSLAASAHSLFCAVLKQSHQEEELVPFYMNRSLEGYPRCTPIAALSAGVDMIARELPAGSPVILLCLRSIAHKASALLSQRGTPQHNAKAGLDLIRLMAQMQLVVEFQFLSDTMDWTQEAVLGCDRDLQHAACDCIHEVLTGSDDYTRKAACALWYQNLTAQGGGTKTLTQRTMTGLAAVMPSSLS